MESSQKISSPIKVGLFVFAIVFSLYAVFTPSLFAQTNKDVDAKSAAKVSQYMQLINSVFGFVLQIFWYARTRNIYKVHNFFEILQFSYLFMTFFGGGVGELFIPLEGDIHLPIAVAGDTVPKN